MQIIHFIVVFRIQFPTEKVFVTKYDFSDTYRRIAHMEKTALETILELGTWAYTCLQLSFGRLVNPSSWCCFSEMLTDLSNELPLIPDWDLGELHSPIQPTVPDPVCKDKLQPFATAKPMVVKVPKTAIGREDRFIYDISKVFVGFPDVIKRHAASALLAAHISMQPSAGNNEPIPRKEIISLDKLHVKEIPKEEHFFWAI